MPRLPTLILGGAAVLLTAGLSALVTIGGQPGAWAALAAGAVAAVLGYASSTRWVRQRIPWLRTFAMELSDQRDACLALRTELKRQDRANELDSWDDWRARIVEWDDQFWALLETRLPDTWRIYRREHAVITERYGANWPVLMRRILDARWQLIKQLSEREHGSG